MPASTTPRPAAAAAPFRVPLPSRRLTGLVMAAAFTILTVTGLVMYLWPPREVAMATGYTLLGMGKGAWQDIHLGVAVAFMAFGLLHVWFNGRALVSYASRSGGLGRVLVTLGLMALSAAAGALLL